MSDADRERVVDNLTNANEAGSTAPELSALILGDIRRARTGAVE